MPGRADNSPNPEEAVLCFPGGLADYLAHSTADKPLMLASPFAAQIEPEGQKFEWALTCLPRARWIFPFLLRTVPPLGGTHENGFRQAIVRGIRAYGELTGSKRSAELTADDVLASTAGMLSVFIRDPNQGQTKEKLVTAEATRQTKQR